MSTALGTLGAAETTCVDERGASVMAGRWTLDWWIGADDRWHDAATEAAVRQRPTPDGCGLETAMRVPGGDAVHRIWAVPDGARPDRLALVVEIENCSRAPFVVATVCRPHGPVRRRVTIDRRGIALDGERVLQCPRPPALAAAAADGPGLFDLVRSAGAEGDLPFTLVTAPPGQVAALWPVPHGTSLRLLGGSGTGPLVGPDDFDPEALGRGWRRHLDRGFGFAVPDDDLVARVERARRSLLARCRAATRDHGAIGLALADSGFGAEAALVSSGAIARLPGWMARPEEADAHELVELLGLWWRMIELGLDRVGDADLATSAVDAVQLLERRRRYEGPAPGAGDAYRWAALVLEHMGEKTAASDVLDLMAGTEPSDRPDRSQWPVDAATAVEAHSLLVNEQGDGLDVLPGFRSEWVGHPIDARGLPTRHGRLSFAVRWHGKRPALLWEVESAPDGADGPTVRATPLDLAWSSRDDRGEALLAP